MVLFGSAPRPHCGDESQARARFNPFESARGLTWPSSVLSSLPPPFFDVSEVRVTENETLTLLLLIGL